MNAGSVTWIEWARCTQADAELFFPTAESGPVYEAQVAAAKAVCAGCPVRVQCLIYAQSALAHGIAGGLTEEERRGRIAVDDDLLARRGVADGGRPSTGLAHDEVASSRGRCRRAAESLEWSERVS